MLCNKDFGKVPLNKISTQTSENSKQLQAVLKKAVNEKKVVEIFSRVLVRCLDQYNTIDDVEDIEFVFAVRCHEMKCESIYAKS